MNKIGIEVKFETGLDYAQMGAAASAAVDNFARRHHFDVVGMDFFNEYAAIQEALRGEVSRIQLNVETGWRPVLQAYFAGVIKSFSVHINDKGYNFSATERHCYGIIAMLDREAQQHRIARLDAEQDNDLLKTELERLQDILTGGNMDKEDEVLVKDLTRLQAATTTLIEAVRNNGNDGFMQAVDEFDNASIVANEARNAYRDPEWPNKRAELEAD